MAKKPQQGYIIDVENETLTLKNGKEIYDASILNGEISVHLKMHGFKQKLVDGCAGLRKALGRDLNTGDYENVMSASYESLKNGLWNQKRETTSIPMPEKLKAKAQQQFDNGEVTEDELDEMLSGIETMEKAGIFNK